VPTAAPPVDASHAGTTLLAERSKVGSRETWARAPLSPRADESDSQSTIEAASAESVHAPPSGSSQERRGTLAVGLLVGALLCLAAGAAGGAFVRPVTKTKTNIVTVESVPASCQEALDASNSGLMDATDSFHTYEDERNAFLDAMITYNNEQSDSAFNAMVEAGLSEKDALDALDLSLSTAGSGLANAACNAAP
jgi:hypothetical protein